MAAALWRFWHLPRAPSRGSRTTADRLLARPAAAPAEQVARTRAARPGGIVVLAGRLRRRQEGLRGGAGDCPLCWATSQLEAEIAYGLAYTRALDGDLAAAQQSTDEAAVMYGRLGDEMGVASTVMVSSMLAELRGERELALRLMDEVIRAVRALVQTISGCATQSE